jgi:hypothetical protein
MSGWSGWTDKVTQVTALLARECRLVASPNLEGE